ncbi:hypothetical protein Lalb_Chr06g0172951 [Lupinus albus]|uniref:Uncharacterized protein n=1 Tax=Lupinus albus TaxID=3870 RepID=A0A6A4QG16_LUPAL|nr:hypothetical protein Lalb_Chr06g0172951 [Lupinus albus]
MLMQYLFQRNIPTQYLYFNFNMRSLLSNWCTQIACGIARSSTFENSINTNKTKSFFSTFESTQ